MKKREFIIIFTILILGLVLRVYRLGFQSFWNDEIVTYYTANENATKIILDPYDVNVPPLYYLSAHFSMKLGINEWLLRLPSFVFGFFSVFLIFLIFRNWMGNSVAIIGAFLMAISPFDIYYSQEARQYALLVMLGLLSVWFFQLLQKNPKKLLFRISFLITTAATFYCHTVAIAFIGFLGLYVISNLKHSDRKGWLLNFISIFFLIIPAIIRLLVILPDASANHFQSFNLFSLPYTVWVFATGYSIGPTLAELHMPDRINTLISNLYIIFPIILFVSALVVVGAKYLLKKHENIFRFATLWLICPLLFVVFGAIITPHPFNVRYAILSFPAYIFFLAVGVNRIKGRFKRLSLLAFICFISIFSLGNYYFNEKYHRDNNKAAGQYLTKNAHEDDLCIVSAAYTAKNIRFYYKGKYNIYIEGFPKSERSENYLISESIGAQFVNQNHLESDLIEMIDGKDRFWLYLSRIYHSDPHGYIRKFCDSNFNCELNEKWNGVELILYRIK